MFPGEALPTVNTHSVGALPGSVGLWVKFYSTHSAYVCCGLLWSLPCATGTGPRIGRSWNRCHHRFLRAHAPPPSCMILLRCVWLFLFKLYLVGFHVKLINIKNIFKCYFIIVSFHFSSNIAKLKLCEGGLGNKIIARDTKIYWWEKCFTWKKWDIPHSLLAWSSKRFQPCSLTPLPFRLIFPLWSYTLVRRCSRGFFQLWQFCWSFYQWWNVCAHKTLPSSA